MTSSASVTTLSSLPEGYKAVVIGASGAIGGAVADLLDADPRCGSVARLARSAAVPESRVDVTDPTSLAAAAARVQDVSLVFVATGGLSINDGAGGAYRPEKALSHLDPKALQAQFMLNAVGPALALRHFAPRTPRRGRALFGALSARVGSIGDNRLGGWYGYRAAKAALNQFLKTGAVELRRTRPEFVVAALHPGTVESPLSAPFRPEGAARPEIFTPTQSAARLLGALDALGPERSGAFIDYSGSEIVW